MVTTAGERTSYDCVVIGGGPAGATCATLLAQHGRRVLVLEKAAFPRHHIGESLIPYTYHTFKRLGLLDALRGSDHPRKESVQFVNSEGRDSQPFFFTDYDPAESSTTWQVARDRFDVMMLDNARQHGVEVRQPAQVRKVLLDGERAVGVRAKIDGAEVEFAADVIVDATGMAGLLSRQLGLRHPDPQLRNAAIYGYYRNAQVDEGRNAGATIIIHTPERNGWFWFIPLAGGLTSVGVVAPPAYLTSGRGDDPAATLAEEIENCPGIARRLADAELVSRVYVTADYSYRSSRVTGDGWVLIGDAFGFLDPVYSSGLMLALKSGEYAADSIHAALEDGDTSANRLAAFAPQFLHGMQLLRQLVYAFYDKNFSFGAFLKAHPQHGDTLTRLLMGDVFDDPAVARIFDDMRDFTELPGPMEVDQPLERFPGFRAAVS